MEIKLKDKTPKKIRKEIIGQVQRFQELSRKITFTVPSSANLRTIINGSTSLKRIRWMIREISNKWSREDLDLEKWIEITKKLALVYTRLINNTGFIIDETDKENLNMIPLALEDIIKDYKKNKIN